jgi:hypothetical protein
MCASGTAIALPHLIMVGMIPRVAILKHAPTILAAADELTGLILAIVL